MEHRKEDEQEGGEMNKPNKLIWTAEELRDSWEEDIPDKKQFLDTDEVKRIIISFHNDINNGGDICNLDVLLKRLKLK